MAQFTNALINETSPYLLQHARNPVNWLPWSPRIFQQAIKEDKLVLISIGYSACHWCHVMEHECFEDAEVAAFMNQHFISVKIDREEHPEVDSLYMSAVQLMTHQGGWPLNCFTLPDGRPVYGGTYFPKVSWLEVLQSLYKVFTEDRKKMEDYAQQLTAAIEQTSIIPIQHLTSPFDTEVLEKMVRTWAQSFDLREGGPKRAPKFPMPSNYEFLLHFGHRLKNEDILDHVHHTLRKMAFGGIYDQIGGGFSRYSVDIHWKVPHFEKMLYDNAQLVSLYTKAWQHAPVEYYMDVVFETLHFVSRELTAPEGGFYAALDADSEGVEGKFYVWKKKELEAVLDDTEFTIVERYYNINERGYWEHDNYVLCRWDDLSTVAAALGMSAEELRQALKRIREKLFMIREKRMRPALDNKILTSWNGLMIKAFAEAYLCFGRQQFLECALKGAYFLIRQVSQEDGGLWHTCTQGKARINGYLEDYAAIIEAWLILYKVTHNEEWITRADQLTQYAISHFSDAQDIFFYFNSHEDMPLISRKVEITDNVIPSGNSIMARNLFVLGKLLYRDDYQARAEKMLAEIVPYMQEYGPGYSNWADLYLWHAEPFHEIAIAGPKAFVFADHLRQLYLPNIVLATSERPSELPMLAGKFLEGKTLAYVCHNKVCDRPVDNVEELLELLKA